MRALVTLTIVMGVMIVAGVVVVGLTIAHRMAGGAASGPVVLDEPAGTRIVSVGGGGTMLGVVLSGGGPDRVVLLGSGGAVLGRVTLKR